MSIDGNSYSEFSLSEIVFFFFFETAHFSYWTVHLKTLKLNLVNLVLKLTRSVVVWRCFLVGAILYFNGMSGGLTVHPDPLLIFQNLGMR